MAGISRIKIISVNQEKKTMQWKISSTESELHTFLDGLIASRPDVAKKTILTPFGDLRVLYDKTPDGLPCGCIVGQVAVNLGIVDELDKLRMFSHSIPALFRIFQACFPDNHLPQLHAEIHDCRYEAIYRTALNMSGESQMITASGSLIGWSRTRMEATARYVKQYLHDQLWAHGHTDVPDVPEVVLYSALHFVEDNFTPVEESPELVTA